MVFNIFIFYYIKRIIFNMSDIGHISDISKLSKLKQEIYAAVAFDDSSDDEYVEDTNDILSGRHQILELNNTVDIKEIISGNVLLSDSVQPAEQSSSHSNNLSDTFCYVDYNQLKFQFVLTNSNGAMANKLRDYLMCDIPVLAITEVLIDENISIWKDPYVVGNLQFIAINADPRNYMDKKSCCLHGCYKCSAVFDMDVTCPENKYMVVSNRSLKKDIQYNNDAKVVIYTINGEQQPNEVAKLTPEGMLKLKTVAHIGYGRDNSIYRCSSTVVCIPHNHHFIFSTKLTGSINKDVLINMIRNFVRENI
jgi:hypothetical protein